MDVIAGQFQNRWLGKIVALATNFPTQKSQFLKKEVTNERAKMNRLLNAEW
jgi:hypothetical protein